MLILVKPEIYSLYRCKMHAGSNFRYKYCLNISLIISIVLNIAKCKSYLFISHNTMFKNKSPYEIRDVNYHGDQISPKGCLKCNNSTLTC